VIMNLRLLVAGEEEKVGIGDGLLSVASVSSMAGKETLNGGGKGDEDESEAASRTRSLRGQSGSLMAARKERGEGKEGLSLSLSAFGFASLSPSPRGNEQKIGRARAQRVIVSPCWLGNSRSLLRVFFIAGLYKTLIANVVALFGLLRGVFNHEVH